jgi:hypothetical protein
VEAAQSSRAPIQLYADAVSSRFIPAVLVVAAASTLGWAAGVASGAVPSEWYRDGGPAVFCLLFGISVLVIACPCALGLAVRTLPSSLSTDTLFFSFSLILCMALAKSSRSLICQYFFFWAAARSRQP